MRNVFVLIAAFISVKAIAQQPYFQQDLKYDIQVRLDDQNHVLTGFEQFDYVNNSPDTLPEIFIHLWPNAYKNNRSAFAKQKRAAGDMKIWYADEKDRGFIDSLDFRVNGTQAAWAEWEGNPDIAVIELPKPLLPGEKMTVTTPFKVKIPISFSRLGHVGKQYQITQWYPKPAVYDREGWHPMPYLDQGEFYSEFGTFDVKINVPSGYVLGSTGDLQNNPAEEKFNREREAWTRENMKANKDTFDFPMAHDAGPRKTLHFHQEKVHDFAWFCDENYFLLTDSVELPVSKRKVKTVAMYGPKDRAYWNGSMDYLNKSVYYYSLWNGDYPYNHATAVDGALSAGAGMEYPNITVVGAGGSAASLEMVIMHEVGHNWYYGILGSNERAHPWMDEGLNTYMEGRYMNVVHGGKVNMLPEPIQKFIGLNLTHSSMAKAALEFQQGQNKDQPVEFPAADYTSTNYGVITYMKTGLSFEYLQEFLGDELIIQCFHDYYETWKFKHPYPADIRNSFEKTTGFDLGWFFEDYLSGTDKLDFRIKKLKEGKLTVVNRVDYPLPVTVALVDKEGKVLETLKSEPFEDEYVFELPDREFHKAIVNPGDFAPEFRTTNNNIREHGLFRKSRQIQVGFLYKYPSRDKVMINWLPALGYNTVDGFMAGVLIHHNLLPRKNLAIYTTPMFGFKSQTITGVASVKYQWLPSKVFERITLGVNGTHFSLLSRVRPELKFEIMPKKMLSDWRNSITLSGNVLKYSDEITQGLVPVLDLSFYSRTLNYVDVRWKASYTETLQSLELTAGGGMDLDSKSLRLDASARYSVRYTKKLRATLRAFAGYIPVDNNLSPSLFYGMSGSRDFLGQEVMVDRYASTTLPARQLINDQGGFSSMIGGFYTPGLVAFNFEHNIPAIPVKVFADLGKPFSSQPWVWDAGLSIGIARQTFKINFPVAGSVFGGGLPASANDFGRNINYVLDISKLMSLVNIGG